ncbi:probable Splicing factor 3B subunit 5 [Serendipita indica DSM 11827]|uniref:Probable Splicing factor 3B subunit 5 n=1 Tax=Serendipita indica (strain DSM 11827) TaxID=1109443 RepID=G4T7U7_SERID|nr:probable Splicing factor 3B subunit 5 [Serendipita indica DSM 11827]
MAKRKAITQNDTGTSARSSQPSKTSARKDDDPLPLSKYISIAGTQAVLLLFSMLMLPRTTLTFEKLPPQVSSLDRPQPAWMAPITAWPDLSVAWICVGAAIVQSYWASKAVTWIKQDTIKETGKQDELALRQGDRSFKDLTRAWGATLLGGVAFHALIVLLGAPMTTHVRHTFALALLISILAVYAPARSLTIPLWTQDEQDIALRAKWTRIINNLKVNTRAERAILYPSLFTVIGAWCGTYPLALDWDRPWQAWPLTPAAGAIIGHVVGLGASVFSSELRYTANTQLEHLHARYTGTGHADLTKWEWATHQHRDTLSSIVGHPTLTSYLAVADGESIGRVKFEMAEKMLNPCGPPPQKQD